jgi:hypothetical protein
LRTAGYATPEVYAGDVQTLKIDVFAFGLILCEILTDKPVFGPELGNLAIHRMA